jgi:putative zinc finger/helix-turn-helix YgiT family protein
MKCVMCENKRPLKRELVTVKYKDCGLDNITIHKIERFHCIQCGEDYTSFGNTDKLHKIIASILMRKKNPLLGKEIRFLRTYLGYATKVFAKLCRVNDATISRIENGKQTPSGQFDILIRALVASRFPDRDYDLHDLWIKEEGESTQRIELSAQKEGWSIVKSAA